MRTVLVTVAFVLVAGGAGANEWAEKASISECTAHIARHEKRIKAFEDGGGLPSNAMLGPLLICQERFYPTDTPEKCKKSIERFKRVAKTATVPSVVRECS